MRVIAGQARSLKLKTIEGMDTRPTQDRIKETLFNMIQHNISGCRFLDLFSGSGGIGIEALSRGASEVVFVENARKAFACIQDNLKHTKLEENAIVYQEDVQSCIRRLELKDRSFDFIFMDPPYRKGFEERILEELDQSKICDEDTIVIVESSLDTDITDENLKQLQIIKVKEYKTNKHTFLQKQ